MRRPEPAYLLEAERGHRRGVVLGLTMAEMMLLLLFCLLLVSGALLQDHESKIAAAERRVAELIASGDGAAEERVELERLREESRKWDALLPDVARRGARGAISEQTWRELRMAQDIGQAIVERDLTLTEVIALVEEAENAQTVLKGHDWPPMITLGSDDFRFVTSSADLSSAFRARLETDVAQQVRGLLQQYDVDVVEVVGHTDEQPIRSTQQSTLDTLAIPALNGEVPITELRPVDNAGLGLARAIAVATVLEKALGTTGIKIVPLSGAQLILPGDVISRGLAPNEDRNRRRIELRVRRSNQGEATE